VSFDESASLGTGSIERESEIEVRNYVDFVEQQRSTCEVVMN
jgi:hypothetical protein